MKKSTIDDEIEKLKNRILKMQTVEPKTGAEARGIEKSTRACVSKIINLEEQKKCRTY